MPTEPTPAPYAGAANGSGPATAAEPRHVTPWTGEPGTVGTVAVVGMGKIGLPLAAQYAERGWHVIGVDVIPDVVATLNEGRIHFDEEPGLAEKIAAAHAAGRFTATAVHREAVSVADVVVMIVPLMLSDEQEPDYRIMDRATAAIGEGLRPGTLVLYETTLPVGDTRKRFGPGLERASGLHAGDAETGFLLGFSPERVFSGRIFRDLATYPKLVGGIDAASGARAEAFYGSALPESAEVWLLSNSEAAEFAKLAETTYRDVNIALANEFARYAERMNVDILEVIRGANSQPFSHIHQPGIGVGGHCIPVYPHFLLSRARDMELVETSRRTNQDQVGHAVKAVQTVLGGLEDVPVLVLGLTYRENVKELAYSRALPLIERLAFHGAKVAAYDPLLDRDEIERVSPAAWTWGEPAPFRAIVTQTADPRWRELDLSLFPDLEVIYDGRNSLRDLELPDSVGYLGVGVPARPRRAAGVGAAR